MSRVIFHLDMDAFYASIEQRDQPSLRGRPVIVGGSPSRRGVVCAASYEARKFGVRSAMPSITAARLCPAGIFLPVRMDHYRRESAGIMDLIRATGGDLEKMSVDEAYVEMTRVVASEAPGTDPDQRLRAAIPEAKALKRRIREERGLTASIGVATNKFLAKLASDFQKPDGLTLIPERDKRAFLRPLPARVIHGVGRVTGEVLSRAGIETVGDLQDYRGDLRALVGSFGPTLQRYAMGEDDRPLELGEDVKSISSEETFSHDTDRRPELRKCLWEQTEDVARRLQGRHLAAHTVQVKVRYGDFTTLTRQVTLQDAVMEARTIFRLACHLLARHRLVSQPLRLLGVGVSGLREAVGWQLPLFDEAVLPLGRRQEDEQYERVD